MPPSFPTTGTFKLLSFNKPNAFISLERSPFLKWSAQSKAFETGKFSHVVHPNLPVFDDDSDDIKGKSDRDIIPPRCVNIAEEERNAFGSEAKHVQTLSASMFHTEKQFKKQVEMVSFGYERQSRVVRERRREEKELDALKMLKIATKMRRDGDIPDEIKFAVVANPNTENVSAEYLEEKVAAGAELIITQPFFDYERCHEWVESANRRGVLSTTNSGISNSNSASLVIGACAPSNRKDVEFWAKLVYGDDQSAKILSSPSSPVAKLAREYEQKERELTTALYRDWIFERCELRAVAALGHAASAGVHFMPVTRIGYDIVKHLARRTREMETMEENA